MVGWLIALGLGLGLVWLVRGYFFPAQRLEEICRELASGGTPSSFVPQGAAPLRRAVLALERFYHAYLRQQSELFVKTFSLEAVLANMDEGVAVLTPDGRIVFANDALKTMFRLTRSPVNQTILEVLRLHQVHDAVQEAGRRAAPVEREVSVVTDMELVEPQEFFAVRASPVLDRAGDLVGVVVILRSLTQLRTLEAMRRDFIANTSHELRTPLAIFKGYLEGMLDEPDALDAAELHRKLSMLKRHSDRLNTLVEDLLTLTRLESHAAAVTLDAVEVEAFLKGVAGDYRIVPRAKNWRIELVLRQPIGRVMLDAAMIEQVMFNLLDNAVAYSAEGSRVEFGAALREESGEVVFFVQDEGIGIPPKDLPHIFERFYRVDKARSRQAGGTGLGLSIVKHVVLAHGGRVWADSEYGKGTRVSFALPLRQGSGPGANGAQAEPAEHSAAEV